MLQPAHTCSRQYETTTVTPTRVGNDVKHGAGGVADQWVAGKGGTVVAWRHDCRNVLLEQHRADGQAACRGKCRGRRQEG